MSDYKTFNDLVFEKHPLVIEAEMYPDKLKPIKGLLARMDFPNGYGISVVRFESPKPLHYDLLFDKLEEFSKIIGISADRRKYGSYTNNESEWEVGIRVLGDLATDENCPLDNIINGYCKAEDVTRIMIKLQELPCIDSIQKAVDDLLLNKE